jgi:transglutaminase-like putative cysteine protease
MKKYLLLALLLLVCCGSTAWAKSRSGIITVEVDLSAQEQGKEARLWLPYPVSDPDQLVTNIKIQGDYRSAAVYTERAFGTPILYADWGKEAKSRKLLYSFAVERQEVSRRNFPQTEPAWNPADYAEFLKPTSRGPIDGAVKALADRITANKTTVLAKARAIYDWTCENMYRDAGTRGCGAGDVCSLLLKPGGKCTDIHSVYVALCRAAGVPAREVFGIRLGKKAEEDITGAQHCWAEFFLPGYGWVPVDPADVRKAMLVDKLTIDDPKIKELRNFFWGGIEPYRLKIAVGRDLTLTPVQAGPPLNTFGYPYAEVGGTVIDWLDPKKFTYRITFKEN